MKNVQVVEKFPLTVNTLTYTDISHHHESPSFMSTLSAPVTFESLSSDTYKCFDSRLTTEPEGRLSHPSSSSSKEDAQVNKDSSRMKPSQKSPQASPRTKEFASQGQEQEKTSSLRGSSNSSAFLAYDQVSPPSLKQKKSPSSREERRGARREESGRAELVSASSNDCSPSAETEEDLYRPHCSSLSTTLPIQPEESQPKEHRELPNSVASRCQERAPLDVFSEPSEEMSQSPKSPVESTCAQSKRRRVRRGKRGAGKKNSPVVPLN